MQYHNPHQENEFSILIKKTSSVLAHILWLRGQGLSLKHVPKNCPTLESKVAESSASPHEPHAWNIHLPHIIYLGATVI